MRCSFQLLHIGFFVVLVILALMVYHSQLKVCVLLPEYVVPRLHGFSRHRLHLHFLLPNVVDRLSVNPYFG